MFGLSFAQTCALSRISGYRIEDWLTVLGLNWGKIAGLQTTLPLKRTRLMDPAFNLAESLPWSTVEGSGRLLSGSVVPIARLIESKDERVQGLGPADFTSDRGCRFAKIGREDCFAFPELLPGSIVRVNLTGAAAHAAERRDNPPLLLLEHNRGLWCGRFRFSGDGTIYAASRQLAYAPIAFRCPGEAKIVGIVDLEIRWLHRFAIPIVPREFSVWRQPSELRREPRGLSTLMREARFRAGLTLREASLLSRQVSHCLKSEVYAIAQSTLSDYEAGGTLPRHLEKAVTICLIYALELQELAVASGTPAEELGRERIPEDLNTCLHAGGEQQGPPAEQGLQSGSSLLREFGQIPWFLGGSLAELSGIGRPSLRDFFRLAGDQPFLPGYGDGSILALVDRRRKRPMRMPNLHLWQQPAWILLLRTGEYRCASCSVDRETLVLYPESDTTRSPERLLLGRDVEVVGQVVGLARRMV